MSGDAKVYSNGTPSDRGLVYFMENPMKTDDDYGIVIIQERGIPKNTNQ